MNETWDKKRGPLRNHAANKQASTSLFGGAILATVATASLAQVTYLPNAAALSMATVSSGYVVLAGNINAGDGGGGTFMPGPSGCVGDAGIVFPDGSSPIHNCFYRADPTNSVREWGAQCNVESVNAAGAAIWNPGTSGSTMGTLTVPTTLVPVIPQTGQSIAISQIGAPTLWGSSMPAVSLTRFSTLTATGTNYAVGDVISLMGSTGTGSFSQQAAIIVDAVSTGGTITKWHFVWGGLYDPGNLPTGAFVQDNSHSYCGTVCGTGSAPAGGATLTAAWSGWSLLNNQTIMKHGSGYTIGNIVTLSNGGGTINQNQYPELIVESADTLGGVTAFDWVDYGSFSTLPTNPATLTAMGSGGLTFDNVAWTQAPFASTI